MNQVKSPKFVNLAGQWVVTVVVKTKDKEVTDRNWFTTEEEALEFYNLHSAQKHD